MNHGVKVIDTVVEFSHNRDECDGDVDEKLRVAPLPGCWVRRGTTDVQVDVLQVTFICSKCGVCSVVSASGGVL